MDLQSLFPHQVELPEPDQPLDRKSLPSGGGVCALTDAQGRLIQTLAAANLRRFLAPRLEPPGQGSRRRRNDRESPPVVGEILGPVALVDDVKLAVGL